jgi:hypothetical protein
MREQEVATPRDRRRPSRCSEILAPALSELGLGRVIRQLALVRAWDQVVPLRVRERAALEDFRGGRLHLRVEDPIWLHELHMLRHKLRTMLNGALGEAAVEEIVLRIGRPSRDPAPKPVGRPRMSARVAASGAAAEEQIRRILSSVNELPCRDVLERLLRRWQASLG